MSVQVAQTGACARVPETDGLVGGACGDHGALGREGAAEDAVCVGAQHAQRQEEVGVPYNRECVVGYGDYVVGTR